MLRYALQARRVVDDMIITLRLRRFTLSVLLIMPLITPVRWRRQAVLPRHASCYFAITLTLLPPPHTLPTAIVAFRHAFHFIIFAYAMPMPALRLLVAAAPC